MDDEEKRKYWGGKTERGGKWEQKSKFGPGFLTPSSNSLFYFAFCLAVQAR